MTYGWQGLLPALGDGKRIVEIISYDKLLNDAKKRNRMLFDKLGLYKH